MSTTEATPTPGGTAAGPPPDTPPPPGRWGAVGLVARAVQVRLRFVVVLAVAFLVVGQWDALSNRWGRLTRFVRGGDAGLSSVSSDTEYFCPMDPGVVSDWPGKCGVCNMALVRRKKGDAAPLPSGVVARMQISPYRLQLAGVRTSPASYEPLAREGAVVGTVAGGSGSRWVVEADALEPDLPGLDAGRAARLACEGRDGLEPLAATVRGVETAEGSRARITLEVENPGDALRPGRVVTVRVRRPVAELEPFRSLPADPPPLRKGEPRSVYLCAEHAEVLREAPGRCPVDGKAELEPQPLLANQRVGWWCPMHPKVTADRAGGACPECGGMKLVPRVVTYRPAGQVLTVPESAVVDTGERTVVYVERMPGMFDGVEVVLGPRCGDAYPVVSGLEPGQRLATAGTFLIDAETRLNPALASAYFGAARGDRAAVAAPAPALGDGRVGWPPALRARADAQKVCPVTGKPLGSMGVPVEVAVAGRTVLVCCAGCEGPLTKSPGKYLARLPAPAGPPPPPAPRAGRP